MIRFSNLPDHVRLCLPLYLLIKFADDIIFLFTKAVVFHLMILDSAFHLFDLGLELLFPGETHIDLNLLLSWLFYQLPVLCKQILIPLLFFLHGIIWLLFLLSLIINEILNPLLHPPDVCQHLGWLLVECSVLLPERKYIYCLSVFHLFLVIVILDAQVLSVHLQIFYLPYQPFSTITDQPSLSIIRFKQLMVLSACLLDGEGQRIELLLQLLV